MAEHAQLICSNSQLCASETADVEVDLAISLSAYLLRVGLYTSNFLNSYKEKLWICDG